MSDPRTHLQTLLGQRLDERAQRFLAESTQEISGSTTASRFGALISLASRYFTKRPLAPTSTELQQARELLRGWNPERWSLLEAGRVSLILARTDWDSGAAERALEEAFRYADEGELIALYRSLSLLPHGERYLWRAGEGCRSNIRTVFEAIATDNPYPARHFSELSWNQMVIKALFVGAPLWRVYGLDERLGPELARMALDLCEERRSAGRPIPLELWACLGNHGGERGRLALEQEMQSSTPRERCAAALGLARGGYSEELTYYIKNESDSHVAELAREALAGKAAQQAFAAIVEPRS